MRIKSFSEMHLKALKIERKNKDYLLTQYNL